MCKKDETAGAPSRTDPRLFDAHCHLGWFADPVAAARDGAAAGLSALAVTVSPGEYLALRGRLAGAEERGAGRRPPPVVGARRARRRRARRPAAGVRHVGEVGLDAAPRRVATWEAQLACFERICEACARTSDPRRPQGRLGPRGAERRGRARRPRAHRGRGVVPLRAALVLRQLGRALARGAPGLPLLARRALPPDAPRPRVRSHPSGRAPSHGDRPPQGRALPRHRRRHPRLPHPRHRRNRRSPQHPSRSRAP